MLLSTANLTVEDGSGRRKLQPKYRGASEITKKINDVTYRSNLSQPMIDRKTQNAFFASLLKQNKEDTIDRLELSPNPVQFRDGDIEYEVQKIIAFRKRLGKF